MADGVQFSLTSIDDLLHKLDSVTHDVKHKGGRFALRKAAQVVRDKAKANAERLDDPETGRTIAGNIAERWSGRRFKRTGDLMFRVGVQHGARINKTGNPDEGANGPTPHWRLLEFGTSKMQAQPFMRPALENNIGAATDTFVREYGKALDRALRRMLRRGQK